MAVAERTAVRKNYRSYVDISKFTGMEVEHQHDTESVMKAINYNHVNPESLRGFTNEVDKQFGEVQRKADIN